MLQLPIDQFLYNYFEDFSKEELINTVIDNALQALEQAPELLDSWKEIAARREIEITDE